MNSTLRGTICGVAAAVFYGTNPLGAMNLYHDGITAYTTLFFRFGIAAVMLAVMMLVQRRSFALTRRELLTLIPLGILMGTSSATLYISFNHMDVGIASTLLFVYPVMVAVIMAAFFREKVTAATVISILLSLAGISLLNKSGDGSSLSVLGVTLVMLSSLSYAIYIVVVNKSNLRLSSVKLTFYVLLFGLIPILGVTFATGGTLQMLVTPRQWIYATQLALMPTVLSLVLMVVAVHDIGSTPHSHSRCHRAYYRRSHRRRLFRRGIHSATCCRHRPHPYSRAAHYRWQASLAAAHHRCHHPTGTQGG